MARNAPIVDPELAEAVAIFKDVDAQWVFRSVNRRLSVAAHELARGLQKTEAVVSKLLELLVDKGLVKRHDPEPGEVALYSPTKKGARVFWGLVQM